VDSRNHYDGPAEVSNRYLPLRFVDRAEAVTHIRSLQAHFAESGHDEEQDLWWGRNDSLSEVFAVSSSIA
jgi:hypothetical protein